MTATEGSVRSGCPGWAKLLLVLSLTGNLVVLGVVAGYEFREEERAPGHDKAIEWILRMVPEERRAMAEAHFANASAALAATEDDRRKEMADVISAIRAEPFDPDRVEAEMAEMLGGRAARRSVVQEHLVTLLAEFTPGERDEFAARLEERLEEWRQRGRK